MSRLLHNSNKIFSISLLRSRYFLAICKTHFFLHCLHHGFWLFRKYSNNALFATGLFSMVLTIECFAFVFQKILLSTFIYIVTMASSLHILFFIVQDGKQKKTVRFLKLKLNKITPLEDYLIYFWNYKV